MAKADDASSTMIWLRDALSRAAKVLGSMALAKERLTEWLAAGKLPWSCTSWKGLDADGLAKRRERKKTFRGVLSVPSAAYRPGDPRFWSARPMIDWEDNCAREGARDGAQALGIRVSRTRLLALLREKPDRKEKVGPQMLRVLPALKKLYPPHGKVADDVSTEAVRARVSKELEDDSKNRGLADPSWDTVRRALGRD